MFVGTYYVSLTHFQKGGHFYARQEITRPASFGERTGRTQACTRAAQADPSGNRKQYYEKGERAKRTHELCNIGGTVESLAPVFMGLPKQEMYEL